ncbi:unnamed protein product [Pleuronectes platessa]|uniref:Uncharacterized protein n=1 Tax=Pleuronectes platessa TaxID=8262 RepID=A0A9N7ZDJ4_PLEPL|nr:unnamed protein product [Pleuronectes platessa]
MTTGFTNTQFRGAPPPRERRVPPAGAIAEVIREKGPTRVQSRCRRPGPLQPVPAFCTADGHRPAAQEKRERRTPSLRRRGEEGDGATASPAAARAQRFNHKYQNSNAQ